MGEGNARNVVRGTQKNATVHAQTLRGAKMRLGNATQTVWERITKRNVLMLVGWKQGS